MLKLHGSFLKWSQCCFKVSFLNVVLVVVFYWLQICSLMRSCYFQNALHTWKPPAYLVWSIQALDVGCFVNEAPYLPTVKNLWLD